MSEWIIFPFCAILFAAIILPFAGAQNDAHPPKPAHKISEDLVYSRKEEKENGTELRMRIGSIMEKHKTFGLKSGKSAICDLNSCRRGDSLLLAIVIPDDRDDFLFDFEILVDDMTIYKQSGHTRGFGLRSFFIALPDLPRQKGEKQKLRIINHGAEDIFIKELSLLPRFYKWLSLPLPENDFTLSLLTDPNNVSNFDRIAALKDAPGVRKAFSMEMRYGNAAPADRDRMIDAIKKRCAERNLSFVAIPCSWWAGTPKEVFDRIDFQQVCWSDSDNHDEGDALKKLLGDKWDIRYGLTVPNMWSSTPWQTMNNPELNALRHERLKGMMDKINEILKDELIAVISENEPAYWAFEESDGRYPVKRTPLWADFNPHTVKDAEKDGVILDPSDGLDMVERAWLQMNLSRYIQNTIDVICQSKPDAQVYSHALLDYTHFPFFGTGHARPYAEVARVNNARLGVEMLWKTDMDALWRIREWGPWANVNREECDSFSVIYHVATLQACFIMGADMLNSYNWSGMGREGDPIAYFNEFLNNVASGGCVALAEEREADEWYPLKEWQGIITQNDAFPWGNQLELKLRCCRFNSYLQIWITKGMDGPIVAYRTLDVNDFAWNGPTTIDLGDIANLAQLDTAYLHLKAGEDWEYFGTERGPAYRYICNMPRERRRSQYVINRTSDIESIALTLSSEVKQ
ncbi:hypothetical protein JW926_15505 [Candidatus Sumerlaeota bacterium]|nr:hypothetical protein [Candidatus Sumerlaeota bacterium]